MKITIFHRGIFFGNTRTLISNGQRTHQTLILLITMSGDLRLNERYKTFQSKPCTINKLKNVLQTIC